MEYPLWYWYDGVGVATVDGTRPTLINQKQFQPCDQSMRSMRGNPLLVRPKLVGRITEEITLKLTMKIETTLTRYLSGIPNETPKM